MAERKARVRVKPTESIKIDFLRRYEVSQLYHALQRANIAYSAKVLKAEKYDSLPAQTARKKLDLDVLTKLSNQVYKVLVFLNHESEEEDNEPKAEDE